MFLHHSQFAYMEKTSKDDRSHAERGREGTAKPEQKLYRTPGRNTELITPPPSASRQTPTTPLASSAALVFVKTKSPTESKTPSGNGAKTAQENDVQLGERDASNSPHAFVKEQTKRSEEPSLVKFALNSDGKRVVGHLWGYVDDTSPQVDKYHVRIDTTIATLTPKLVIHMNLAYDHAMDAEEKPWLWGTKYTDPTGQTLPEDLFATFIVEKGNKEMSQGLATPMMTQTGGTGGHYLFTNAERTVTEEGATYESKEPAGTAAGTTSALATRVTDEGSEEHDLFPNAKEAVTEEGAMHDFEDKAGTALGKGKDYQRGVLGKGVDKTSDLPYTNKKVFI
jgi:hypothetical protein